MAQDLLSRLEELIAHFNRRVLDVPDGLFDRNARLLLNGVPYETLLGGDPDDPLIRMIARGAAGYRFAVKGVLRALEPALAARDTFDVDNTRAAGVIVLRGTLRGSGVLFEERVRVELQLGVAGVVTMADVSLGDAALDRLRAARAEP